ncbi:MAG: hypothetical protein AAB660_02825 [Patescibacteria group bacterium]
MKKVHIEIIVSVLFVALGTLFVYGQLAGQSIFWNSQMVWSTILAVGWMIVALGYYNQGWIVHTSKSAEHVSVVLPIAVFFVQCVFLSRGFTTTTGL